MTDDERIRGCDGSSALSAQDSEPMVKSEDIFDFFLLSLVTWITEVNSERQENAENQETVINFRG